jgi:hypothetical protein
MFKNRPDTAPRELPVPGKAIGLPGQGAALAGRGLGDALGQLAAAIERARELPGRATDARELRQRLTMGLARLDRKRERIRAEIAAAKEKGHEFAARRLRADLRGVEEERADASAMLAEVDRVLDRLRRERRSLLYRLGCGEALADALPPGSCQVKLREAIEDARRHLAPQHVTAGTGVDA